LESALVEREAIHANRAQIDEAMRRVTHDSQRVALANFLRTETGE
jgi:hypothetical protein